MSAAMFPRCSHCGYNGHGSGTCLDSKGGFTLFGVRLSADCCEPLAIPTESSCSSTTAMRKSVSMGNLCNYGAAEAGASPLSPPHHDPVDPVEGYASDDLVHTICRGRKKGIPWMEEEHRMFLLGLQKLGKGDWRGISRNFVKTRTPTQVASHAQKYFLRLSNSNKRRRRSSLFDMIPDTVSTLVEEPVLEEAAHDDPDVCPELTLGQSIPHGRGRGVDMSQFSQRAYPLGAFPVLNRPFPLALRPMGMSSVPVLVGEAASRKYLQANDVAMVTEKGHVQCTPDDVMEAVQEVNDSMERGSNMSTPGPPLWPGPGICNTTVRDPWATELKIVKPTPVFPRPPQKVQDSDEVKSLTFKINTAQRVMDPSPLSYKLLEEGSRHSAFHSATTVPLGNREVDGQGGLSNAISVP